jgi:hypothetical protein
MTNEQLKALLEGKSEEFREGFFAAVNSTSGMKAAFLEQMIGQEVSVTFNAQA